MTGKALTPCMTDPSDPKRRSVKPYLEFLRRLETDVPLDTRLTHVLDEFGADDFAALGETLADVGVTAGFSVLAIHLDRRDRLRAAVADLADAGHEVLLHGYRHTSFRDVAYETAYEELSRSIETLSSVVGRSPSGFHVPYATASPGALRAASDLGVEWVVGAPADEEAAPALPAARPVGPYDLQRLERGDDPEAIFADLSTAADAGSVLLCHPNVYARPATDAAFTDWLADGSFATPGAAVAGGADDPGLLLDCFPPFRVA